MTSEGIIKGTLTLPQPLFILTLPNDSYAFYFPPMHDVCDLMKRCCTTSVRRLRLFPTEARLAAPPDPESRYINGPATLHSATR